MIDGVDYAVGGALEGMVSMQNSKGWANIRCSQL